MRSYRVDLHVHIGRNSRGEQVKVTGARDLTLENIARRARTSAGLEIVGIIDCASPRVIRDILELLDSGHMTELEGGGLWYSSPEGGGSTVIAGVELEAELPGGCTAHYLCYLPTVAAVREFSREVAKHMTNVHLSTQRVHLSPRDLASLAHSLHGLYVPAHVFTPHKGVIGGCVPRLAQAMGSDGLDLVDGVELGLSADTYMADTIAELSRYTFLSNSDAHSLPRLGREFNVITAEAPSFNELAMALRRQEGRRVTANYGLDPKLGKYHLTGCDSCGARFSLPPDAARVCPACSSTRIVVGVADRLAAIADSPTPHSPPHRPKYHYQVPLQFIPGLGPARIAVLVKAFGSELSALHDAPEPELAAVVGERIAGLIMQARSGMLQLDAGGGGQYGRVSLED